MIITLRAATKKRPALKAEVDNDLPQATVRRIERGGWYRFETPSGIVCAARREPDGSKIYLHRLIIGNRSSRWVRFKNGNGLDCRKKNLLVLDPSQLVASIRRKAKTQSGFRGVNNIGGKLPWQMRISIRGRKYRSVHRTAREAAAAYDKVCVEHLGSLAVTNKSLGKLK